MANKHQPAKFVMWLFRIVKLTMLAIVVLAGVFLFTRVDFSNYFPIKSVHVYGINHASQKEVKNLLLPLVNHGFFDVKVERIRERLQQLPWVSDLYVKRVWPDQVKVTLIEKTAVAIWNQQALVGQNGELFTPKTESQTLAGTADDLPIFIGPAGEHVFVLENFKEISRLLLPIHVKISKLELTPFLTWKLTLDNGITMQIGHKDILTRLDHFVKVYPKIISSRIADVEYIDLRYPNGMAVRWKGMH